ncbi:MAG TPA: DUF5916 domain-containing protein [Oligoflexus sp.]|uniref:DUF5916 domain-containing protein n=1 Tax=Oligoflexus sp. TaxID=1971216 RepID=UPI002D3AE64F|nr:DUF5916 domain-containing protein [Oligoflexus sp.]HYX32146.1 DUF5916 domain-containing protein [Oligoflexus sp.]
MNHGRRCLLLSLMLLSPMAHAAAGPLTIAPIATDRAIDGLHDDSVWQDVAGFELKYSIVDQGTPRFRTIYKVLYDKDALYFEITAFDDDMSQRRQKYSLRDQPMTGDDDRVSVIIDPIGNKKFGQVFGVNSACVPFDAVIDEVNAHMDSAPQFNFSAECETFSDSWRARLKIPFAELKYKQSPALMTLLVDRRFLRETNGLLTSSPLEYFGNCLLCQAQQVTLIPPEKKTRMKAVVEAFGSRIETKGESKDRRSLGLSLSLPLSLGTTVDATWHPDYSQVDADAPYLAANNPFPVLLGENRPFFMEGNDILFAPMFTAAQSRAIVSPDFGVKLLSRHEHLKIFALVAGDQHSSYRLTPGTYESDFVEARAPSHNLITRGVWNSNDQLTLGLTVNAKREEDLHENTVWGPEMIWKPNQWHRFFVQALSSVTQDAADPDVEASEASEKDGWAQGFGYGFSGERSAFGVNLYRIQHDFENDLGFMPENGVREAKAYYDYSSQLKVPALAISDVSVYSSVSQKMENDTTRIISRSAAADVNFITDQWLTLTYGWAPEADLRASSEGELHQGHRQKIAFSFKPPQYLSVLECKYRFGDTLVYSEDKVGANTNTMCRMVVSLGLHLSGEYSQDLDRYRVKENGHRLDERVQTAVIRYFLDRTNFLRVTLQSRDTSSFEAHTRERSTTLLLGHQDIDSLSAYLGVNRTTLVEDVEESTVEYFAKLSCAL